MKAHFQNTVRDKDVTIACIMLMNTYSVETPVTVMSFLPAALCNKQVLMFKCNA